MPKFIDLTGATFGSLTVVQRAQNIGKQTYWECKCNCGVIKAIRGNHLRNGLIVSCGCITSALISAAVGRHRQIKSLAYSSWESMKERCQNPNLPGYKKYGAKGIKVCERWQKFENFYADMGDRPAGTTLDRIDPLGNYEPGNCRWASHTRQARNKTNSTMISYRGETKHLSDWCEELGLDFGLTRQRINRDGWAIEKAFQIG